MSQLQKKLLKPASKLEIKKKEIAARVVKMGLGEQAAKQRLFNVEIPPLKSIRIVPNTPTSLNPGIIYCGHNTGMGA